MAKRKSLAKTLEGLPWIVRLILTIIYGFFGNLIRLFRSLDKNNTIGVILAVILLLSGGLLVLWVVDVVCVAMNRPIWWID